MKTYGIYLAYPPALDLRAEGLGRLLAEFLKAAKHREDIRFVIACPSWSRQSLRALFDEFGIYPTEFEIVGPETKPILLRLYEGYQAWITRKRSSRSSRLFARVRGILSKATTSVEHLLVTTRSRLVIGSIFVIALPFAVAGVAAFVVLNVLIAPVMGFVKRRVLSKLESHFRFVVNRLRKSAGGWRLFRFMEEAEAKFICGLIDKRKDIRAWYSPTAFWPDFNRISAPRLICVPDVVLAEFPISFSSVGGERFLEVFRFVERAIEGGEYFVTYSDNVKQKTLIDRYYMSPEAVFVVPHGVNNLNDLITVSGSSDGEVATNVLCLNFFRSSLQKAIGSPSAVNFYDREVRFIFYASQFRPNKNVISLLRAYEYLLKRRFIGYKLVLTGNPKDIPEVARFISDHNLQNDVLCLHGLSARELAACYRLADLAVNPSLSEGGCPFTLTEALSVGTPVVMAKIAVTEEVVTDPDMRDLMLFDPYDWKAIADKIEWALQNKELLLERQLPLYNKLAERTWQNVVDEHVAILDRISSEPRQSSSPA